MHAERPTYPQTPAACQAFHRCAAGAVLAVALALGAGCDELFLQNAPRPTPTPSPSPTAAPGTTFKALGQVHGHVFGLQFVNPNQGWIVGDSNQIHKTDDGGQTWTAPAARPSAWNPNVAAWNDLSFVDPRFGFVGGAYGLIKTTDGGATWTPIEALSSMEAGPPPYEATTAVRFRDYEHGVAVRQGLVHRTTDGGTTWKAWTPRAGTFRRLGMIAGEFAVLTDAGLYRSAPDGSWTEIALPTPYREDGHNPEYADFWFLDDQVGWVLGAGQLNRTIDGGRTWVALPEAGGEFGIVRFLDPGRGWVFSKRGMLATRTGGATWEKVPYNSGRSASDGVPSGMQVLDATHVYLYGGAGGIRQWVP